MPNLLLFNEAARVGIKFSFQLQVGIKHPDDSPAADELVEITVIGEKRFSRNYTSRANGKVEFTVSPAVFDGSSSNRINVST